jgi:hypothetical protein
VKVRDTADEPADLGRLTLSNEDIRDLGLLAGYPDLVSLRIKDCPRLADLSALAGSQVSELSLDPAVGLATLAGPVRRLELVGGRLVELPPALPLQSLTVVGVPSIEEIRHLALFPGLTHLAVHRPREQDLVRLRALALREIDLYGAGLDVVRLLPDRLVRLHSPLAHPDGE